MSLDNDLLSHLGTEFCPSAIIYAKGTQLLDPDLKKAKNVGELKELVDRRITYLESNTMLNELIVALRNGLHNAIDSLNIWSTRPMGGSLNTFREHCGLLNSTTSIGEAGVKPNAKEIHCLFFIRIIDGLLDMLRSDDDLVRPLAGTHSLSVLETFKSSAEDDIIEKHSLPMPSFSNAICEFKNRDFLQVSKHLHRSEAFTHTSTDHIALSLLKQEELNASLEDYHGCMARICELGKLLRAWLKADHRLGPSTVQWLK
jgi:hypothetical protein